jgi:two-component system phosphate regulon response regulator OmpR
MTVSSAPARKPRVLVVDDDARLRAMLAEYLRRHEFEALVAADCAAAARALGTDAFSLIVLDLALPDGNGLDFCRDLRARGDVTPVLMLTARADDVDRVVGLEIGADDYLAKPYNPRELIARVRAILRRTAATAASPGAPVAGSATIRFGACVLDPATRTLTRNGVDVPLTTAEFAVLHALASRAGQTLSRDQLARLARGRNAVAFDRSIDMQISRLRKLIEPDPAKPRHLQTVWGAGYTFVADAATVDG